MVIYSKIATDERINYLKIMWIVLGIITKFSFSDIKQI